MSGSAGASAVAASPTGAVFVTGGDSSAGSHLSYVTIGYDGTTGAQLWVSHYDGAANMGSTADAATVSPDGSRVFVTGWSEDGGQHPDYATVAYDASTPSCG